MKNTFAARCDNCRNWETWGIAEIAVRNPNVSSYVEHWESRALKAEMLCAQLTGALEKIGRCHGCGCVPCMGQCTGDEANKIATDEMRDIARAALGDPRERP